MPDMEMGAGGNPAALVLAELTLFWGVTLLQMIRLLSVTRRSPADQVEGVAHMAMGVGMTVMVFPGVPMDVMRALAVVFAVLAAAFVTHAVHNRARHRCQNAAIGAGPAAMAYMFAAPAHPPTWLPPAVAGVLAVCALAHGRQLVGTPSRTCIPGPSRLLLTLPHAGALMTTVAMAWMVAA